MQPAKVTLFLNRKQITDGVDRAAAAVGMSLLVLVFALAGCAGPKKEVTYNQ